MDHVFSRDPYYCDRCGLAKALVGHYEAICPANYAELRQQIRDFTDKGWLLLSKQLSNRLKHGELLNGPILGA